MPLIPFQVFALYCKYVNVYWSRYMETTAGWWKRADEEQGQVFHALPSMWCLLEFLICKIRLLQLLKDFYPIKVKQVKSVDSIANIALQILLPLQDEFPVFLFPRFPYPQIKFITFLRLLRAQPLPHLWLNCISIGWFSSFIFNIHKYGSRGW